MSSYISTAPTILQDLGLKWSMDKSEKHKPVYPEQDRRTKPQTKIFKLLCFKVFFY